MYKNRFLHPDFDWGSLLRLKTQNNTHCGNRANPGAYYCTRPKGHQGPHVAHGTEDACAIWDSSPEPARVVIPLRIEN